MCCFLNSHMLNTKQQVLRQTHNLQLRFLPLKNLLVFQGPCGILSYRISSKLNYLRRKFWVSPRKGVNKDFFVLDQSLLNQSCLGVTLGYRCQLNLVGVGYQANVERILGKVFLVLKLGFSHQVKISVPSSIKVTCPKPRLILITGVSLQKVKNFAALVRDLKLPNSYKEKGLYYKGEILKLKQGKKT